MRKFLKKLMVVVGGIAIVLVCLGFIVPIIYFFWLWSSDIETVGDAMRFCLSVASTLGLLFYIANDLK